MPTRRLATLTGLALALVSQAAFAQSAAPGAVPAAPSSAPAAPAADLPSKRPNILIWLMDDVGYGQVSAFGGLVETPNIDRVAARGLKFSNFHVTPICSSSRASLLTGRNPHSVRMGGHAQGARPFPGYDGYLPPEAGTVAAYLRAGGYATFALGKWDHLPAEEMTPAGPFNRWPTGQGFDRFYGFLAADMDNWAPSLLDGITPLRTPTQKGYHLDEDLANQAIRMVNTRYAYAPRKPFFMYWATGTAHAPHHAPKAWIERYKGKFDMGWDKAREIVLKRQKERGLMPASTQLAPRPEFMPAWDSLSKDQRRLYAHQMEVFAASLSHADHEFGRILDALEKSGELDNTIVMVTSDNGASAEGAVDGTYNEDLFVNGYHPGVNENLARLNQWGGPGTTPHYALGWAVAGNTPLRYYKQTTYAGGMRVPMVFSWPQGVATRGEVRNQFVHVSDVTPTLLELAGIAPTPVMNNVPQMPLEGLSFRYALADATAADRKQAQYAEMYGNKGLWSDGWTLVTNHRVKSWDLMSDKPVNQAWELYNVTVDPGQTQNLAAQHPDKVAALAATFEEQATRFNVNPVGNISEAFPSIVKRMRGQFQANQGKWVFPGNVASISGFAAPPLTTSPFRLSASMNLSKAGATGPIFAYGGDTGGMSLFLNKGVPSFALRALNGELQRVAGGKPLPAGTATVELELDRKPSASPALVEDDIRIVIKANGKQVAARTVRSAIPRSYGVAQVMDIGGDNGSTVSPDYPVGTVFPGQLGPVTFDFNKR